jgi:hypothetical protein
MRGLSGEELRELGRMQGCAGVGRHVITIRKRWHAEARDIVDEFIDLYTRGLADEVFPHAPPGPDGPPAGVVDVEDLKVVFARVCTKGPMCPDQGKTDPQGKKIGCRRVHYGDVSRD